MGRVGGEGGGWRAVGGRLAVGWRAVGGGTSAARRLPASARAVGRCARLGAHTVAGIGGAWAWADA